MLTRSECEAADRADPLRSARDAFLPGDPGTLYFDANSVGAMPVRALAAMERIAHEWQHLRRRGWSESDWLDAPMRLGDKLAPLLGAAPGQLLVGDSTSINLHKALSLALGMSLNRARVITQADTFPTDLYVAEGIAAQLPGMKLEPVHGDEDAIEAALERKAGAAPILYLSHTDYRTGRRLDMARLGEAARRAGALTLWDLSHSAGAGAIALDACGVDLAVGCGYKYLCGGPGAPGYLYVARRHQLAQRPAPWGWMGHADQFAFEPGYRPASGMRAHLIGTPAVIGNAVLEAALDTWAQFDLDAAWRKREALAELVILRAQAAGFSVLTPLQPTLQGGFIALRHPQAVRLIELLADRQVVCSYRPPDVIRFGLSPLVHGFVDIWDAFDRIDATLAGLGADGRSDSTHVPARRLT